MEIHPSVSALQLSVLAKACRETSHRSFGGYCTSSVKLLNIFTLKRRSIMLGKCFCFALDVKARSTLPFLEHLLFAFKCRIRHPSTMLKVGFPSLVAKAVLKMKNICSRKFACPSFCWSYFLVVIIVGRREYSLQIMWWVGNAEVSSIWKHFILINWLSCDSLFDVCFIEWAFKYVSIHKKLCIGFLLVGICLLCGLSLLDSNQFLIFDPYHSLFSRTSYRYTNIQTKILGDRIYKALFD